MILVKKAHILNTDSKFHGETMDILIHKGLIKEIAPEIKKEEAEIIELENLHLSAGWMDSSVSFGTPGFEERQSIENGIDTAAKSGFTSVLLNPNNNPNPENAAGIRSLISLYKNKKVDIYPVGNLTLNQNGEHLAELFDMHTAGAISFYDFKKGIKNSNLLKIALQYSSGFNGLIQSYPEDYRIAGTGMVNEDAQTIHLGLKSKPALAESLQVARDIEISRYTNTKIHFPTINTIESLELIKKAKSEGLPISCSIAAHHLILNSNVLDTFNQNYKLQPPLRDAATVKKIKPYLLDRTIDMVTSDHIPLNIEHKDVEFDQATYGSIGLESCFGILNEVVDKERAVDLLTGAYSVFNIDKPQVEIGEKAKFTLFDPTINYRFTESDIISKSKNAAAMGLTLKGKVYGIINGSTTQITHSFEG
ncbi:MAG: dihydroorotase [Nonlabens sp.]